MQKVYSVDIITVQIAEDKNSSGGELHVVDTTGYKIDVFDDPKYLPFQTITFLSKHQQDFIIELLEGNGYVKFSQ